LVKINIETNDEKLFSFAEEFFAKGEQLQIKSKCQILKLEYQIIK